jgi:hypothetical protein
MPGATYLGPLPDHGRFDYQPITRRPDYRWPGGAGLAVYLGFNIEHFAFGEGPGRGHRPGVPAARRAELQLARVRQPRRRLALPGAVRRTGLPAAALINTALYDHAPELVAACVARGDELVGHGHSNAERQGTLDEAAERALLAACRGRCSSTAAGTRGLAVAVDQREPRHARPAGRDRLPLHAELVPRRPADAHAHAQRAGCCGPCPTRRSSTTSR